jgi:hypothetical protein
MGGAPAAGQIFAGFFNRKCFVRQLQFNRFFCALGACVAVLASSACSGQAPAPTPAPPPPPMPVVGGQRDAHGCLPAAGYSWCAKENACVRPWELAAKKGFPNGDKAAFDAYCTASAK